MHKSHSAANTTLSYSQRLIRVFRVRENDEVIFANEIQRIPFSSGKTTRRFIE